MLLITCYKHPVFHQMLLSIQGMIRFGTDLVSGSCVMMMLPRRPILDSESDQLSPFLFGLGLHINVV